MTGPRLVFPLDDNTFILNGRTRPSLKLASPSEVGVPAEEVAPDNLLGDQRGQHRRRMWAGIGLWAFIILAACVAIPIGLSVIGIAIIAKPAILGPKGPQGPPLASLTSPSFAGATIPAEPASPSPNVIEDMRRFAETITLPSAQPPRREISRPRVERITSHHPVASKPEEPQNAPIGCPPSVCFPWRQ